MESTVTVREARKILGDDAVGMSDDEILEVIKTLDLLAKDALKKAHRRLNIKQDAKALAELIYDTYQDEKKSK